MTSRKFAFFGPYITTSNAQELRDSLLVAHKAGLQKHIAAGAIKYGGPFYHDDGGGQGATDRTFGGSFFLLEAESREAALEVVKADEYYIHGMWDIPNIKLVEYRPLTDYPSSSRVDRVTQDGH